MNYVVPVIAASVATADVDGKCVEKKKPGESVMALEMLAAGKSYNEINEATGLGFGAISSLKARHEVTLDIRRKQLAADAFEMAEKLRLLVHKKAEMLIDDEDALKKVNIRDLVLPYGISMDKGLLALGEQKVILEHRTQRPSLKDAMAAIEEARKALQKEAIPVEATDEV